METRVQASTTPVELTEPQSVTFLRHAIGSALAEVIEAQGEWHGVEETFAPEWTHGYKRAAEILSAALGREVQCL